MKDQLIFDVTDANTIAESDSVGAYIRSSDGTLITHTTVGGKEALDVRLAEGVNVEVDLSHLDDSVRLGDGTDFFTSTSENGDIALDVHISNSSIAVTATDLDIRDLSSAQDSVEIKTAAGQALAIDASGFITVNQGTSPWVVSATDLDVRDLAHTQDSVRLGDGTDLFTSTTVGADIGLDVNLINASIVVTATDLDIRDLSAAQDSVQSNLFDGAGTALTSTLVGADQALDVNVVNDISINDAALANTAIKNDALAIAAANTRESLVGTALTDRKYLYAYNADNRRMYIGSGTVTVANGFPVSPGSYIELRAGASVDVQVISEKLGHDIRTLELS